MTKLDAADQAPACDLIDLGEASVATEGVATPTIMENEINPTFRDI